MGERLFEVTTHNKQKSSFVAACMSRSRGGRSDNYGSDHLQRRSEQKELVLISFYYMYDMNVKDYSSSSDCVGVAD